MSSEIALVGDLMLADDDADDRFLITRALGRCRADLQVQIACDGIEVMEQLRERCRGGQCLPRLILLDLNMPRMDGREVLRALKADVALRDIPVVVLTTSVETDDLRRAYKLGAASFISKPEEFGQMMHTMRTLIEYWFGIVRSPVEAPRT